MFESEGESCSVVSDSLWPHGLDMDYQGFPRSSAVKESTCNAGYPSSIPGLGRSTGERIGYPLQYSGLENSMDCIVYGITKSQTRLNDFHLQWCLTAHGKSFEDWSIYFYDTDNLEILTAIEQLSLQVS